MQENSHTKLVQFLQTENDYITYLLEAFEVPETQQSKKNRKMFQAAWI